MQFTKTGIAAIAVVCAVAAGATVVGNTTIRSQQHDRATAQRRLHLVDIGFSQHMAMHHDQAVVMAKIVQGHASVRTSLLADAMATAQLLEIGEMKGWLKLWGAPALPASAAMDWIFNNPNATWNVSPGYFELCRSAPGGMPGLATSQQLDALRRATGTARDILFLQLMLRHHQGALPMAQYASVNAETAAVRSSAAQMVYEQRKEINAIARLLHQLGSAPLPSPFVDSGG